jgi:hypothetical protein
MPGFGHQKDLAFGILVLLILGGSFYLGPLTAEAPLGHRSLAIGIFGALFLIYGMVVELAYQRLDQHLLVGTQRCITIVFSVILLTIPCVAELLMIAGIVTEFFE